MIRISDFGFFSKYVWKWLKNLRKRLNSCFKKYPLAVIRKTELEGAKWGMRSPGDGSWDGPGVSAAGGSD